MKEMVVLQYGAWQARILPEMGMNTLSLTYEGCPVLRTPESLQALLESPSVYGVPILLPPNRTEGGRFCFDGVQYHLPINEPAFHNHLHGAVLSSAFAVTRQTQQEVTAVYENDGGDFPFPYRLEVCFCLTEKGYRQTFAVTNTGNKDMPLTFGLHTIFASQCRIQVPIGKRWRVNDCYIPTGELEELSEEARSYRRGMCPEGKLVRGFYTAEGNTARVGDFCYRVSENFDQWVLWNGDGDQGFCAIEPLRGAVNALNSGVGLLRLAPGETERFETEISRAV